MPDQISPPKRIRIKGRFASAKDLKPEVTFIVDGVRRNPDGGAQTKGKAKLQTFRVIDPKAKGPDHA